MRPATRTGARKSVYAQWRDETGASSEPAEGSCADPDPYACPNARPGSPPPEAQTPAPGETRRTAKPLGRRSGGDLSRGPALQPSVPHRRVGATLPLQESGSSRLLPDGAIRPGPLGHNEPYHQP